jgi:predicted nucleic acid-binding protein
LILDTNALSAFVDGDGTVGRLLEVEARACLPVIALGEFRYGILQSRHRMAYEAWLRAHLDGYSRLARPLRSPMRRFGRLCENGERRSRPMMHGSPRSLWSTSYPS